MPLSPPEPLADRHTVDEFDCGDTSLNDWLRKRALVNQMSGASRTFVLCDGLRVVGYYALASGAVDAVIVPGRFRRNMPDPVPVVLLGRLAIDVEWQGKGRGRSLMRDAALRVMQAADTIGIRGIVVHALNDTAKDFYVALGFTECPGQPLVLVMTLQDIRSAFAG